MKKVIKRTALIVIFVAAAIILFNSLYTVKYNNYALVKRFGKVTRIDDNPGLHIKTPFIENVQLVYSGTRVYDIPTSDVITKDKKSMIADDYVLWKVTDPVKYYKTLGAVDARAEERIDAAVYNATKNTISSMTQDEVIAARGAQLTDTITNEANSDIADYGIVILTAEIKALDLPDDNKNAVYERMISERQNIAASYTAKGESEAQMIKNETNKEVTITIANAEKDAERIIAEGEAEYMRILSEAYNDPAKAEFYNYLRGLDALKASLKSTGNVLMLDKDSELVKILYGTDEVLSVQNQDQLDEEKTTQAPTTESTTEATTESTTETGDSSLSH
ncbi:MAG TPA: protease modulator HflC [Lachnospiraceae bacterium]|nr:protease modulator HflC [Lachnospiraceae bacterium]